MDTDIKQETPYGYTPVLGTDEEMRAHRFGYEEGFQKALEWAKTREHEKTTQAEPEPIWLKLECLRLSSVTKDGLYRPVDLEQAKQLYEWVTEK